MESVRLQHHQGKILCFMHPIMYFYELIDLFSVSLAATWDKQVIKDVCQVLISEAKSKEVDVLLGPTGKSSFH